MHFTLPVKCQLWLADGMTEGFVSSDTCGETMAERIMIFYLLMQRFVP